ncbi:probable E3 ubiquitin-protein ligase TRIML1 [Gracilinanus agilis]|uniref:probable E3 ubiquitin-protein ligase TRIML1 n=1 Tax=Gracilinanus agilis TaxID=191870 RepID=UPI001CFF4A71|nr:probable E3 ubiquitin-protein ligase TRIML1 [Gracilinanus agilis]
MASFSELMQNFQEELICSVCKEYLTNPITIECGHNFCHRCLFCSWQATSTPFSCPECRAVSQLRDFQVNVRLGKLVAIVKKLSAHCLQNPEGHNKCKIHQKTFKLFCKDDQSLVCLDCSESPKHKAHTLYCINEAAEDFREKLQETTMDLKRKTDNVVERLIVENVRMIRWKKEIKIRKRNVSSEFQKLHRFLDEKETEYLSVMERHRRANLKVLKKRMMRLSQQSNELRKMITELEEEYRKPHGDLLQDMQNLKGVLNRNELVLQQEDMPPIKIIVCPIPRIIEILLKFKVEITLDCNTASPGLIISEDLKSVRYGGAQVLNNSGMDNFAQVFGTQSLISGRYYWEVEAPSNIGWSIGICNPNLLKEIFLLIAAQSHSGYHLYALGLHHVSRKTYVKYCQNYVSKLTVGIFFDCERGKISFYNVKESFLIFTFTIVSSSGPFYPIFFLSKKAMINDSSLVICP